MKSIKGIKVELFSECYSGSIGEYGIVVLKHQKPVIVNEEQHNDPVAGYQYVINGNGKTFSTKLFTGWFRNNKLQTKGGFNALPAFGLELDDLEIEMVVYKKDGGFYYEVERIAIHGGGL